ncbi:MAG: hypothetical protein J0H98_04490 [Solirubrobacterales bacterium]|nr:hypothetical protein [Solirubrobacterales bacterium]
MIRSSMGRLFGLISVVAALAAMAAFTAPAQAADTVKISGWAWVFVVSGSTHGIEGATIKVEEMPDLQTTTDAGGYWELEVPKGSTVTPYASSPGYYTVHDQTFSVRDDDLRQVNFQMPSQGIVEGMGAIAGAQLEGEAGSKRLKQCAVVSTVYQKEGRSFLTLDDFLHFAPHGIEGSTASLTGDDGADAPAGPVYFGSDVIPNPTLTSASRDGGIVWPNVPEGTWTVSAQHPDHRFSTARVTCEPGRLVNASPPWGLYEMYGTEEPNPAVLPFETKADQSLDAEATSVKVVKRRKRAVLVVKMRADEPVTAEVTATQGRAKTRSGKRRLAAGSRTVSLPLAAKRYRRGGLKVTVRLSDESGNARQAQIQAFVPQVRKAVKKAKRHPKPKRATKAAIETRSPADTVTISGNAYAFIFAGDTRRLEGAEISIAEYPEISTVAGANGAWSLVVPNHAKVTPFATFPDTTPGDAGDDYFPTYAQTFYTSDRDITRVNFQMPKQAVAEAMASIVGAGMTGTTGKKQLTECAVVSTFFRLQRTSGEDLIDGRTYTDFDDFHNYRPHGVADSTATMTDATGGTPGDPVYFNSSVIPDPSRTSSSSDGGVLWRNIPAGEYTVRGQNAEKRFGQAQITCAPGRLVNASPPWGLYELAGTEESNPATFPAPPLAPDTRVGNGLRSATVVKSGRSRKLHLAVFPQDEPVTVRATLRQGKRRVTLNGRLGQSKLERRLPAKLKSGPAQLTVRLGDKAGNARSVAATLNVPR